MPDDPQKQMQPVEFFEGLWNKGDYWALESDPFEQAKFERQLELLRDRRYGRVLEIGCGAGMFTRQLAGIADHVLAIDVSSAAIARANSFGNVGGKIEYRVADVMKCDPERLGPFDLCVISETIYYLGCAYTFFEVAWLGAALADATADNGRLILTNTRGESFSHIQHAWVLRTYRDLFINCGFKIERDEIFRGRKNGVDIESFISLYSKPAGQKPLAV